MNEYEHTGNEVDLRTIDNVRNTHVAALNAGDAHTWAAQFTDDGVQMPPNMPINIGRSAIEPWATGFLDMFAVDFALSVDEVQVLGEWAFERGTYTIDLNPKTGGPSMQDSGKYITVYQRKSADGWRMARDIWNSNNPLPVH